jgi:hypothetical protein
MKKLKHSKRTNFVKLYSYYADFLEIEKHSGKMTPKIARKLIKNEILDMIAINGVGELYESERELAHKIGMRLPEN